MTLEDLSPHDLRRAQEADLVVVKRRDGRYETLKDREHPNMVYSLLGVIGRIQEEKTATILWVSE